MDNLRGDCYMARSPADAIEIITGDEYLVRQKYAPGA